MMRCNHTPGAKRQAGSCLSFRARKMSCGGRVVHVMKILFLGDIVGSPGVTFLKRALPGLVAHEKIDLVIANAENASSGAGMTPGVYRQLRQAGVDLVTMGDHIYKRQEIIPLLKEDPRICKPANYPEE